MPLESDYYLPVSVEEEEFIDENATSAATAADADICHDSFQDNPVTAHHYSMPDLVEVDSDSDDKDDDDDDNTDGNEISGVPISNRPSASTTRNASRVPQTPISPKNNPTSITRNEPRMYHIPVPIMVPP